MASTVPPPPYQDIKHGDEDYWGEESAANPPPHFEPPVGPKDLLRLAQQTLAGLAVLTVLAGIAYLALAFAGQVRAAKVFETMLLTVIPALVTLIVGFYFGKKDR